MIHLYCGDGKGKTTAAIGLVVRALGRGKKVVLLQFLKSWETGEVLFLQREENLQILRGKDSQKFSFQMTKEEKATLLEAHTQLLREALEMPCDMLVLDEAMAAYNLNLLDKELLQTAVEGWGKDKELVLTGRDPQPFFLERADYVSEMMCRKHPFEAGVPARKGVEF